MRVRGNILYCARMPLLLAFIIGPAQSQVQPPSTDQVECMEALRAFALSDFRGAVTKMVNAQAVDQDRNNPWLEFWEGVISAQDSSVSDSGVEAVASSINSTISRDGSGILAAELELLWKLDSQQRGMFAFIHRNYYCSPDSLQQYQPPSPPVVPDMTTTVDDPSKDRIVLRLGSDGYIYFELPTFIHKSNRVWNGEVYDYVSHGIIARGVPESGLRCRRTELGRCEVDDHDILSLDCGSSYVVRLIDGVWYVNVFSAP